MRIGIDIDGVLTNIERFQLDYGSKFYYEKYKKDIANYKGYETFEIFDSPRNCDDRFWLKYFIKYIKEYPARDFSSEVISKLKKEGHEIYIITARFLSDKRNLFDIYSRKMVVRWLKNNKIKYDKIIFSDENKFDEIKNNKIDLMIEDKVKNIKEISKIIPVICFNASYNEELEGKNIIRCYSWYDIYSKIHKIDNK